jgi:hypothetical protein
MNCCMNCKERSLMNTRRRTRGPIAAALALSLWMAPGAGAQDRYEPVALDALEAQEAAADILDTYERVFKTYDSPVFAGLRSQLDLARGVLFSAPEHELERMGQLMGADLLAMRQLSRQQAAFLLDREQGGPYPELTAQARVGQGSASFPTLNPDLPAYPGFDAPIGITESEIEAKEADREDKERDRETDADRGAADGFQALICVQELDDDGRILRVPPGGQIGFLIGVKLVQLVDGVLHDLCGQTVLANCSACCVVSTVVRVLAEALYEAHQLCEGLRDGAEIEAAYHNGLKTFEGVEHVHGDLEAHAAAIGSQLDDHNTAISGQLSAHHDAISSQLSSHDTAISSQLATHDTDLKSQLTTHDTDLKERVEVVQGSLDNELERRRVHLDVVEIQEKKRYMVVATEGGERVEVAFTNVSVSAASPVAFVDVTASTSVSQVDAGVYLLALGSPPALTDLISISVRHDDVVDHFGQVVFHRVPGSTKASQ